MIWSGASVDLVGVRTPSSVMLTLSGSVAGTIKLKSASQKVLSLVGGAGDWGAGRTRAEVARARKIANAALVENILMIVGVMREYIDVKPTAKLIQKRN